MEACDDSSERPDETDRRRTRAGQGRPGDDHGFDRRVVSRRLSADPNGAFVAIIGPNGCGKSTLFGALARVLTPPRRGAAGRPDDRQLPPSQGGRPGPGLLPQTSLAPEESGPPIWWPAGEPRIKGCSQQWSRADEDAVAAALAATRLTELSGRLVDEPSGGAAAGVGGHAARPADADPAAGRADHVLRHRPPVRAAGFSMDLPPRRQDGRRRAARPESAPPATPTT